MKALVLILIYTLLFFIGVFIMTVGYGVAVASWLALIAGYVATMLLALVAGAVAAAEF